MHRLLRTIFHPNLTTNHQDHITDDTPIQLYKLLDEQQALGWHQLLYGRWSKQWITQHDTYCNNSSGKKWAAQMVHQIWLAVINKWLRRCEAEHNDSPTKTKNISTELEATIHSAYETSEQLDNTDREFFHQPITEILARNNKQKKQWIKRAQTFLSQGLHRARLRTKMKNHSISTFFAPRKQQSTTRSPDPHQATCPKAYPADLRPP
jgi:hypothetical protein